MKFCFTDFFSKCDQIHRFFGAVVELARVVSRKVFKKTKQKKEFIDDQIILVIYICVLVLFLSQTEGAPQKWFKIIGIVFFKISQ